MSFVKFVQFADRKDMEIRELCDLFNRKGRMAAVKKLLDGDGGRAVIDGLAGSSAAILLARLPERGCPTTCARWWATSRC